MSHGIFLQSVKALYIHIFFAVSLYTCPYMSASFLPSYSKSQGLVVEAAFAVFYLSCFQLHKTCLFLGIFACDLTLLVLLCEDVESGKVFFCHKSSFVTGLIDKTFYFWWIWPLSQKYFWNSWIGVRRGHTSSPVNITILLNFSVSVEYKNKTKAWNGGVEVLKDKYVQDNT